MARHRNIRSMNYSDEYDGYDDVYGHSVEDDICISPSDAAQFMYDRDGSRGNQRFGAFMKDNIPEESEKETSLSDVDLAKLRSAMDQVEETLGNAFPPNEIKSALLKYNFNVEQVVDALLCKQKFVPFKVQPDKLEKEPPPPPSVKVVAPNKTSVVKGFDLPKVTAKLEASGETSKRAVSPAALPSSGAAVEVPTEEFKLLRFKESKVDAVGLYSKERGSCKDHLYMVVIGHVDAGKSTLMGRLLCDLGQVNQRTMHKYEQESKKLGKQSFMYAWVLDETGEERNRGITMDVGRSQFETDSKLVTLLDAPGHKDFIPNMISGAAQADVALLVVDATRGEFETGFESGGQTREHALLVRSLGVGQLAVVVNKLDTVNWSADRFQDIVQKLKTFLKLAGFRDADVAFVPCSGMTGENLVKRPAAGAELLSWYDGPCLLEVIDKFRSPERPISKPFRLSINDIFKATGSGFCVSGRVETGCLTVGDKVMVCPTREYATVKAISIEELPCQVAFAGDQVSATLSGLEMQNVAVGYILCDPARPVQITSKFQARLVVFNVTTPITKGFPVILHHQSLAEPAFVMKLVAQLNKSTGEVVKKSPKFLGNNSSALVEVWVGRPIGVEVYSDCKELGRVMLRSAGVTIAAGLITKVIL